MTYRRLVTALLAAASGTASFAQPAAPAPAAVQPPSVTENLRLQYANGIVAVAEDKIITVADVMHEIAPLLPQLKAEFTTEKAYVEQLDRLQDGAIQDLIDRVLIIKEFRKDDKRHIPISYIDNAVADDIAERFDGDRSKFLAYLKAQGKTKQEYRRDKEEEIIYHYMQGQQKKSQSMVSPVRIETYYNENKDQFYKEDEMLMRMIQFKRTEESTDESLKQQAAQAIARLKAGEKFEDVAKDVSTYNRAKGGEAGVMQRSSLKPEFSDAAFNLKKGEYSDVILLPEGAYILYAEDRHYAGIQPLDEVRDKIERILNSQMTRTNQERWLERLRRNGYIKHY